MSDGSLRDAQAVARAEHSAPASVARAWAAAASAPVASVSPGCVAATVNRSRSGSMPGCGVRSTASRGSSTTRLGVHHQMMRGAVGLMHQQRQADGDSATVASPVFQHRLHKSALPQATSAGKVTIAHCLDQRFGQQASPQASAMAMHRARSGPARPAPRAPARPADPSRPAAPIARGRWLRPARDRMRRCVVVQCSASRARAVSAIIT